MGTAIGMRFDDEASNFHLRWNMEHQVREWKEAYGLNLDPEREPAWRIDVKESVHPPLTASRTTGAEWKRVPIRKPPDSDCHLPSPVSSDGT